MSYAATADVQAYLNQLGGIALTLGAASTPTTTQVTDWLLSLSAEVDAVLRGRGYGTIPATGATDVALIKLKVAQKAAAMAYRGHFQYEMDTPGKVKQWDDEWAFFISDLMSGAYLLINQSPTARIGIVLTRRYRED